MKEYNIKLNNEEIIIYQDGDGKFIKPDIIKEYESFGTSLKPAHEPIVVARKPLSEKTVAENVLKWGTGGINIDGCRIETIDKLQSGRHIEKNRTYPSGYKDTNRSEYIQNSLGRFPANIILDEEAGKLLDEQSGTLKSGAIKKGQPAGTDWNSGDISHERNGGRKVQPKDIPSSEGGASRFFYCAKVSKKERGEGNNHPTVKPLSLMQYLVRLVTPTNGIVLDPFVGSGTTCLACIKEDFQYIGFELESNYCEIAQNRIKQIT